MLSQCPLCLIQIHRCFFQDILASVTLSFCSGQTHLSFLTAVSPSFSFSIFQRMFPEKLKSCTWLSALSEAVVKRPFLRLPLATMATAVIVIIAMFNFVMLFLMLRQYCWYMFFLWQHYKSRWPLNIFAYPTFFHSTVFQNPG